MTTIRILRIVNRFNLGGITYNVSYLSKYLPPNYETLLIGGPEEKNEASSLHIPHSLGLEPVIIQEMRRSVNPLADYLAYRRIRKLIRQYRPHIVHTHASKAGAIGRLAAIRSGVPVIVHTFHGHVFHGYFGKVSTAVYKAIERLLAKKSSAVIAISELQKKELAEAHGIAAPHKIYVVPLGFDLGRFAHNQEEKRRRFREQYALQEDELAAGIIGRLVPIKDHRLFIRAVASCVKRSRRKIRAVIIGDGECRQEIEREISAHQLTFTSTGDPSATFIFTGWIRDVDAVLPGLDLVCLTSRNEGTPVSLIEAQAGGKFVVSTEVGGVRDILHRDCGLLSPAGDDRAFAENLLYAFDNFETLSVNAGKAAADVMSKFSYQRLCSDMHELYSELLRRAKGENLP